MRVPDLRPDDGMLLTSSVRGIVAVASVDGQDLQTGLLLLQQLLSLVEAAEARSILAFRATFP